MSELMKCLRGEKYPERGPNFSNYEKFRPLVSN